MAEGRPVRRLAAILTSDMVGYSRLIQASEDGTIARQKAHRANYFDPKISAYNGRIFKSTGDGLLVEFPSALDAVMCAIDIQQALIVEECDVPDDERMTYRIGIHIGDVVIDGDDMLGDGVNIAARLEAVADPGGVCVSARLFEHVKDQCNCDFDDLGEIQLKNIAVPQRVYRVRDLAMSQASPISDHSQISTTAKPSIAILPFDNLSNDPDQDYFADGMVEEITAGLSGIRWLTVIGRNSSYAFKGTSESPTHIARALGTRYLLKGSVRRASDRVRINTSLLDGSDGSQLWAERFEGSLADIFDLQDSISQGVVGAIEPSLRQAEIARSKRMRQDNLGAYDLYLRALSSMYEVTAEGRITALSLAKKALEIDPDYAEAHGVAAWCYFARSIWERGQIPESHRDGALYHGRAVQSLHTQDASTLAHAAIALAMATQDHDSALAMIDQALRSNPSSVQAHGHGAVINAWAGNYERAIELGERSLKLSPFDPLSVMPLAGMAGASLSQGEFEQALTLARRALQIYPTHAPSHLITIVSLMRLDREAAAAIAAKGFLKISPEFLVSKNFAPILSEFNGDLEAAGLPV